MSPLQLLVLAIVAMIGLATLRVARANAGRTPLPGGVGKLLFILAFLVVPPIVVGALIAPGTGVLRGGASIPLYVGILAALAILMWIAAVVVRFVVPRKSRPLLLLALVGSEGDPDEVPVDPPVTAKLAEDLALVDRANAAFPRGPEFPAQIDRADFRPAWDALDAVTGALEDQIAADCRLGLGAASTARATAKDARNRLDTLRKLAVFHGQTWAGI